MRESVVCKYDTNENLFLKFCIPSLMLTKYDQLVGVVGKDIAIGAGGVGFDSWIGQIGHNVAKISPKLQYFIEAVLPSAD